MCASFTDWQMEFPIHYNFELTSAQMVTVCVYKFLLLRPKPDCLSITYASCEYVEQNRIVYADFFLWFSWFIDIDIHLAD